MYVARMLVAAFFAMKHLGIIKKQEGLLTVGSEASSVGLGVLAVHTVGGLGDDETVRVHHGNDVEGELAQVAGDTGVGASNELITNVPFII